MYILLSLLLSLFCHVIQRATHRIEHDLKTSVGVPCPMMYVTVTVGECECECEWSGQRHECVSVSVWRRVMCCGDGVHIQLEENFISFHFSEK